MQRWREALRQAENADRPDRRPLLDLYADVLLDAHLASTLTTRRLRVVGTPFALVGPDGQPRPQATALLRQPWFDELVRHVLDAAFYGHSLIEIMGDGPTLRVELIPRLNVVPELGLVTTDAQAPVPSATARTLPSAWMRYGQAPYCLLEVTSGTHLGLLNQAVPYVLFKRVALSCWAEFAEVFGMPLRIGRTPARDPERKRQLAEVLRDMGSAAYAVLDEGEDIQLTEYRQGDAYHVYDRLVERCNLELAKLINGQTLTTEPGDRGARALGTVHDNLYDDITRADLRHTEQVVSAQLLPLLARFPAYAPLAQGGLRLQYQTQVATLSLPEQWAIDQGILQHYRIDPAYIRTKYGVPVA